MRNVIVFVLATVLVAFGADNPVSPDGDYDYVPPVPGSYSLPIVKPAGDGALIDSDGKPINLRDLTHGRMTVLSFIYTRCAAGKACPYATSVLGRLHILSAEDKTLAANLRLVSLSFDTEYDTHLILYPLLDYIRE